MLLPFLLFSLTFCVGDHVAGQNIPLDSNGENVCQRIVTYVAYTNVRSTTSYRASYTTCTLWTWFGTCAFGARKTKYRTDYRTVYKQVSRLATKTEYICCHGWSQLGTRCPIPICDNPCINGKCASVNHCKCDNGWTGSTCNQDINECSTYNGQCDQVCVNKDGGYNCSCHAGYEISPKNPNECLDIDECKESNYICLCVDRQCNSTCVNNVGNYTCQCSKGFRTMDNRVCQDIDECQNANGGCSDSCINQAGSYRCQCRSGYELEKDQKTCKDINECTNQNGGCSHLCTNNNGSYTCSCRAGYFLDANKRNCSDHDECATAKHDCQHKCENTVGGYVCACPQGFQLNADNRTCSDINECKVIGVTASGENITRAGCSSGCVNLNGTFKCTCLPGWILLADGKTCSDYDECLHTKTPLCAEMCINTIGSYKCICKEGYQLAINKKDCAGEPCVLLPPFENGNSTCQGGVTGDQCVFSCKPGFILAGTSTRKCMPNHQWSGIQPTCKRLQCSSMEPPLFTGLQLPCDHNFESSCQFKCEQGYHLNTPLSTRTCSVFKKDSSTIMKWDNNELACEASSPCSTNRCKNRGVCFTHQDTAQCDCTGTGFAGSFCEQEVLLAPDIVVASTNVEKYISIQMGTSKKKLHIKSNDVSNLQILGMDNLQTYGSFKVLAKASGFYYLDYATDNKYLNMIGQTIVYVKDANIPTSLSDVVTNTGLFKGLCQDATVGSLNLKIRSNLKFDDTQFGTHGVVSIDKDSSILPLSMSGGNFKSGGFQQYPLTDALFRFVTTQVVIDNDEKCFTSSHPSSYITELFKYNGPFGLTFLQAFNSKIPYWIHAHMSDFDDPVNTIKYQDISASVNTGQYFLDHPSPCMAGFPIQPDAVYYIYQPEFDLILLFPSQHKEVPRKRCFIVDLTNSNYFIGTNYTKILPEINANLLTPFKLFARSLNYLGFMNKNEQFKTTVIGDVSVKLGQDSSNLHLVVNMKGKFEQTFSNTSGLFDKGFKYELHARTIETSMTVKVKALGKIQSIEMKGKFDEVTMLKSYKDKCQNGTSFTGTFTPTSIEAPAILSQLFEFDIGHPITIQVVESDDQSKDSTTITQSSSHRSDMSTIQASTEELVKEIGALKLASSDKELSNHRDQIKAQAEKTVNSIKTFLAPTFAPKTPSQFTRETTRARNDLLNLQQRIFIFKINYKAKYKTALSRIFNYDSNAGSRIMAYTIKQEPSTQSIQSLKITGMGRICVSKHQCISSGKISLIAGTQINTCFGDSLLNQIEAKASVVTFEMPDDSLISSMFKVSKGDTLQLTLPERGHDDHFYTFSGRWKFVEKDFTSDITLNYFDEFDTSSVVSILGENTPIFSSFRDIEVSFTGNLNVVNGMASKKIIEKFHELVDAEEKRSNEKSTKLDDERKSMEEVLSRHNLEKTQENLKLDQITAKMTSITGDIQKQTSVVDGKRAKVRESLSGYILIDDFMKKCAVRPNYCRQHCTSHIDPGVCTAKDRIIYKLVRNCAEETVNTFQISIESSEYVQIRHVGVSPQIDCSNKCPKLFAKNELISKVIANIKSYGHCYRFCREVNNPSIKYRNMSRPVRTEKPFNERTKVCSNVLRQIAAKPDEPYGKEKELCFNKALCMVSISPDCLTAVDTCEKSISDLSSSNGQFKTSFGEFRKEINLLEILKLEKEALQRKLNAQNALVSFINDLIADTTNYISDLHNRIKHASTSWSNNKLSKYKVPGSLIITELSFKVTQEIGSASLPYFPLKIKSNDSQTGDILVPVEIMFEVWKPELSVFDAAHALMDMIQFSEETSMCFKIEASAVYLNNFIMTLEGSIRNYQKTELQHSTDLLQVNASNQQQFSQIKKLQVSGQNAKELQRYQITLSQMFVPYPSWNSTMTIFLAHLQSLSHERRECSSFKDCMKYHVQNIKTLLAFHNTSSLQTFNDLEEIFMKLIHYDLSLVQTKNFVNAANAKMINHDPVIYFCGDAPVLKNQISDQILVNEGEDLIISLDVVNKVSPVTVTWKKDGQIIGGSHLTEYKKKAAITDEGWYTCNVRNRFGKTDCGLVKVTIVAKPIFHQSFNKLVVYEKSPERYSFLVCNVTNEDRVQWLYRSFEDSRATRLSGNQYWLNVLYSMSFKSGYYWCEASNNGVVVGGPKIAYSRQSASIGIEQVPVSLSLGIKNNRRRRDLGSSMSRRQIPTTITSTDLERLKLIVSNSLGLTNADEVLNLEFTKESNENAKIRFALNGRDLNAQLSSMTSWDGLTESNIADRKRLLGMIGQVESKMTPLSLRNGQILELVPDTIEVSNSKVLCQDGFGLLENGVVCGECSPGTKSLANQCTPCELDHYQPKSRQTACVPCLLDHMTENVGTISSDECKNKAVTVIPPPLTTARPTPKPESTTKSPQTTKANKSTDIDKIQGNSEDEDDGSGVIIGPVIGVLILLILIVLVIFFVRHRRNRNKNEKFQAGIPTDINNPTFDEDPYARIPFQDDNQKEEDVYKIPERVFKRDKTLSQTRLVQNPYTFDGLNSSGSEPEPPYVTSSQIRPSVPKRTEKSEHFEDEDDAKKQRVILPKGNDTERAVPNDYSTSEKIRRHLPNNQVVEIAKTETVSPYKAPPVPARVDIVEEEEEDDDEIFKSEKNKNGDTLSANQNIYSKPQIPVRPDLKNGVPPVPKRRMQSRSSVGKDSANQYETLGSRTFQNKTNESKDDPSAASASPYDHLNREFNC